MKFLPVSACAALAAVVLAMGGTASFADGPAVAVAEGVPVETVARQASSVVQTGKTLGPLSPDEVTYAPVTVPEPVWASVLAACAVIILRRGRQ
jgi:hypothetical protein